MDGRPERRSEGESPKFPLASSSAEAFRNRHPDEAHFHTQNPQLTKPAEGALVSLVRKRKSVLWPGRDLLEQAFVASG